MSTPRDISHDSHEAVVDRYVEDFERSWRDHAPADLARFVAKLRGDVAPHLVSICLGELVKVDLELRCREHRERGLPIRTVDEYANEFPELVLGEDLIVEEFLNRSKWGDEPSVDEFRERYDQRFPSLISTLAKIRNTLVAPTEVHFRQRGAVEREAKPEFELPKSIDRYTIIRLLGEGTFARVMLARDQQLQRLVAIKLPRELEQTEISISEAVLACSVSHPNLVTIYDLVPYQAGHAIVMEYVEGVTLKRWLKKNTYSRDQAIGIIRCLAEALHECHRVGVFHCDFKPDNILIDAQGRPRLSDFGLSIRKTNQREFAGRVAGSPAYMAPEQIRGEAQWLDGRTDIWALGVLLYEMLVGRRPFQGLSNSELFDEILHREPQSLRQLDDSIPLDLERICQTCLAKRVRDRFPSARDVAEALSDGSQDPIAAATHVEEFAISDQTSDDLPTLRSPIGRDSEIETIETILSRAETRHLCLVGTGGIGKTTIAVAAARRYRHNASKTRFISLASVTSSELLYDSLISALGIPRSEPDAREDPLDRIVTSLRSERSTLLVLDSVEQVVSPCRSLLKRLSQLPHVKVITTSRVRMSLPGTRTVELFPLASALRDPSEEGQELPPALRLFEVVAQEHQPDFEIDRENRGTVAAICEQVDGIPLAIELAAARISLFDPAQILERLKNRSQFLAGVSRANADHEQSLSEAIRWSFALLSEEARQSLMLWSMLPDGVFTEDAEQILTSALGTTDSLATVQELRDHSLVRTIATPWGKRLTTFRPILDELVELRPTSESEFIERLLQATCRTIVDCVEQLSNKLRTADGVDAAERMLLERDTLLALQKLAAEHDQREWRARITLVLNDLLIARGATAALEEVWALTPPDVSSERRLALHLAKSRFLRSQGQWDPAYDEAKAALRQARQAGDDRSAREATLQIGLIHSARGDYSAAYRTFASINSDRVSHHSPAIQLDAMAGLGHATEYVDNPRQAAEIYDRALVLAKRCGDRPAQAKLLRRKGNVASRLGDFQQSLELLNQSIDIAVSMNRPIDHHLALTSCGVTYSQMGEFNKAIQCYDQAQQIAQHVGARRAIATNEGNRGVALSGLGDHVAAIHCFQIAAEINADLGNRTAEAINRGNLAVATAALGRLDQAELMIRRVLDQPRSRIDHAQLGVLRGDLGVILFRRSQFVEAEAVLGQSIRELEDHGLASSPTITPFYHCLALCAEELGKSEVAHSYRDRVRKLRESSCSPEVGRHPLLDGPQAAD